jgi:glycosyltransferase involved in cell wall biosynthesis
VVNLAQTVTLSVVVNTYNQVLFVEQCLKSVLSQVTSFGCDVVVVDDASEDGTFEILSRYADLYPDRVRLVRSPVNRGVDLGTLELISHAQGKYVALLEGDDYGTDDAKLQKQVDCLGAHPDVTLCGHAHWLANEINDTRQLRQRSTEIAFLSLADFLPGNPFHTGSLVFRNGIVRDWPAIFEGLAFGDWPLQILLAQSGRVAALPDAMSVYRVHAGGAWTGTYRGTEETGWLNADGWRLVVQFWELLRDHLSADFAPTIDALIERGKKWSQPPGLVHRPKR